MSSVFFPSWMSVDVSPSAHDEKVVISSGELQYEGDMQNPAKMS